MELGLFSPCSNVEKLPPSPFLGHTRTEKLLKTVSKSLAPRQEGLSGAKTLFPGCFNWRQGPRPIQDRAMTWGLGWPHHLCPSIPVSPSHNEALGLSPCHRSCCIALW